MSALSGVVLIEDAQMRPPSRTSRASPISPITATGLPVSGALTISAIAIQPRMPVPAASPRMVITLPRADRIRIRMPMLAMAYMATHLEARPKPSSRPSTGMPSQNANRLFQTLSHITAKTR